MNKTYVLIACFHFSFISLSSSLAMAQEKGVKKAEFLAGKVIITKEIAGKGPSESQKNEVDAPEGYAAIRGDSFTDVLPLSKYDRTGEKEQTLPVVNLSREMLTHYVITYVGKDTVQLPDQVLAIADHFTQHIKELHEPEDKDDIWIDDRGFLVLSSYVSLKWGVWISYQEAYKKGKNKGIIRDLHDGQYFGSTEWEVFPGEDISTVKLESSISEKLGGFAMSVEYKIDKDFNPKSYIEHWSKPGKK